MKLLHEYLLIFLLLDLVVFLAELVHLHELDLVGVRERRVNAAIGEAQAAAAAEVAEKARARLAPRRAEEVKQAAADQLKPWGCEVKRDERRPR